MVGKRARGNKTVLHSGHEDRHERGVGFVLHKRAAEALVGWNQNIKNTRESIRLMVNESLRYSFILYEDTASANSPMSAEEAIDELANIRSTKNTRKASQTSAFDKFMQLTQGRGDDLLVFYLPCEVRLDDPSDMSDINELVKES
ncbi:hypothetical protein OSTOST_02281 [Ostertagia ostertagi]